MKSKHNTVKESLFDIFELLGSSNDKEIYVNKYFISAVFDYHSDTELEFLFKQWLLVANKPTESLNETLVTFKKTISSIHEHQ